MNGPVRRALAGPITLAIYLVLVVPLALGSIRTAFMTPLALPGYLLFVIGTSVGNAISPNLDFRLYWIPFLVGCYLVSVVVGYTAEAARDRRDGETDD